MPVNKAKTPVSIFWFRRDLRLHDNRGLFEALTAAHPVLPLFIFDEDILSPLPASDPRISYIYEALSGMQVSLGAAGSALMVRRGCPPEIFRDLLGTFDVQAVFCNLDHEPYGQSRDQEVNRLLQSRGIPLYTYLDHLIFGKEEVLKADGKPYLVFTPYSRQWKKLLHQQKLKAFNTEHLSDRFLKHDAVSFMSLKALGFRHSVLKAPRVQFSADYVKQYDQTRDIPSLDATSHLGPGLRFGLYSIREVVGKAAAWNESFLNELIWREFYAMIMWHFPEVVHRSFRKEYDRLDWVNDEKAFGAWKSGHTGYPMVDAGMRQLNETGFMHNRLRMLTASFLSKHLLTDWRWGEAYFAEKLFDYELSSNNGGWQWAAGTGTDAAPYFRIFNPGTQQQKFDPDGRFVSKWVPEYGSSDYISEIIDHKYARERCLRVYRNVL